MNVAVFASGTGSNFQAFMETKGLHHHIVLLVCDNRHAPVLPKALFHNVPTFVFEPTNYTTKEAYEREIVKQLMAFDVEWIFLAGYMRLIGPTILWVYEGRIVNIHPSLLPQFKGRGAIKQALDAHVNVTGVTIHYVDEGIDTGPIIAQERVYIRPDDTFASLKRRIQMVEHKLYPRVVYELLNDSFVKGDFL